MNLAGFKKSRVFAGNVLLATSTCVPAAFSTKYRIILITSNLGALITILLMKRKLLMLITLKYSVFQMNKNFMYLRPTVLGWYDGEADSRIKLKGIYPGATVSLHPEWPYGREVVSIYTYH